MADYDLLVIGGGPAGYVGAIRAAQLGKKVACIERDRAGGTCLNWGCIPTKALLKNAQLYTEMTQHAAEYGLEVGEVKVDWEKVIGRSRMVSDRLAGGIEHLFKKNGVEYLRGEGKLGDNGRVEYTDAEGATHTVTAEKILLATGAAARSIPGLEFNGTSVLNARQAMVIPEQPKSIAIIGAGAIGVEFAHFFAAFGTEVTIIEMMDRLLPVEDEEVSKTLGRAFKKQKIGMKLGHKTVASEVSDSGVKLTLEPAAGGEQSTVEADCVLVAVGVGPILPEGSDKLNFTERGGWVQVDQDYQTNIPGLYACGDISGPPWLAHTASFEAIQAVEGMFVEGHVPKQVEIFPGCTYCHPEVASVGKTEQALKEEGVAYKVGKFPFMASGRAQAVGDTEGFVKLLYGEQDGELLGAHIIGPEATELIAEMCLAITMEATYEELENTIHAHPTLSEAIHEATGAALGHPIHI